MTLPRTLEINGRTWRVVLRPMRKFDGLCFPGRREIHIDSKIPPAEQQQTFLHELIHACFTEDWSQLKEEKMIRRLSPRLLAALQGIGWAP